MTSRTPRAHISWIAAVVLIGACGGAAASEVGGLATLESGESGETTTTSVAATEADIEEAALAFSQCMRDEGVTDFPDPQFSEGGGGITLGGPDGEDPGFDPDSDEVRAAFEACGEVLERAAFGPGGREFDETELQDNLLSMAECLREQGVDVDDPDLSNFGPVAGGPPSDDEGPDGGREVQRFQIFPDLDMEDPDVRAAMETCQAQVGFGPAGAGAVVTEDDGQ